MVVDKLVQQNEAVDLATASHTEKEAIERAAAVKGVVIWIASITYSSVVFPTVKEHSRCDRQLQIAADVASAATGISICNSSCHNGQ